MMDESLIWRYANLEIGGPRDEDELVHRLPEHPFCTDASCPCHEDESLIEEYLTKPLSEQLMTEDEAKRLYRGQQIV